MEDKNTENVANQTEIPVSEVNNANSNPPNFNFLSNKLLILIGVVLILASAVLGVVVGNASSTTTVETKEKLVLQDVDASVPIPEVAINNPMFSNWSGSVKGRVVRITENQIILAAINEEFTNDGQRIITDSQNPNPTTITVDPNKTEFYSISYGEGELDVQEQQISFNTIAFGTILEGTVQIDYDFESQTYEILGDTLTVRTE